MPKRKRRDAPLALRSVLFAAAVTQCDEAERIAANIAKLPRLSRKA